MFGIKMIKEFLKERHKNSLESLKSYRKEKQTAEEDAVTDRLTSRKNLLDLALKSEILTSEAAVVLQNGKQKPQVEPAVPPLAPDTATKEAIGEAVKYRLAISDLFVEKAQFHLEDRARRYKELGYTLYIVAIILLSIGGFFACGRMLNKPIQITSTTPWVELLYNFIVSFTAYGFIVLTAVALMRGARACLDQRERLLTKRHSLRQGRLYLHLSGERAWRDAAVE